MDVWNGETITEGWRALDLFTDRLEACRRFLSYVNDDPSPSSILYFHGDGGNGKSILLEHQRTHLCKRVRPENWAYLATLADAEAVAQVEEAEDTARVPVARLDFAQQGTRDALDALAKLRRELSGSGLHFPLFDFAVVTYLHKARFLSDERLGRLFPADELAVILELAALVTGNSAAAVVLPALNLMERCLGERFQRYRLRRNLDEARVHAFQWMDHETELIQHLPRLFAEDLNAGLGDPAGPNRVALFFDTHEAFWGHERELVGELYFGRDEWFRRLLAATDRAAGVVTVVAGREPPRWSEAPRFPVADLDLQYVGDFADADAIAYLAQAGVTDPEISRRLCEDARVAPDQVHPFYLGLGADLALAADRRRVPLTEPELEPGPEAVNRRQRLVDRLLRYVDAEVRNAVRAVSVCRSFDAGIYRYLAQELQYQATRAGFDILTSFSFVRRLGDGRFRIHDLLRRLELDERGDSSTAANAAMERYYRERVQAGDELAVVDAIYHANRLDLQRGATEWLRTFDVALRRSRFDLCGTLLEIRDELATDSIVVQVLLAVQEADYFHRLSRYDEAREEYERALGALAAILREHPGMHEALSDRGNLLVKIGELEVDIGNEPAAEAQYQAAIMSYDAAIENAPLNYQYLYQYLSNRANALVKLGDLQGRAGHRQAAGDSYRRALAMVATAIRIGPPEPQLLSNLGTTLVHTGNLLSRPRPRMLAERYYCLAVAVFGRAVRLSPRDPVLHNNLGSALHNRGKLYARQRRRKPTERYYRAAIRSADDALRQAPNYLIALSNKGMYCEELGWLILVWARPHRIPDAREMYQAALDAYARAADLAPDNTSYREAVTRHGNRLVQLGG